MGLDNHPPLLRGIAALSAALNCIGGLAPNGDSIGDHAVAKIVVDNELELRALVKFAVDTLAEEL